MPQRSSTSPLPSTKGPEPEDVAYIEQICVALAGRWRRCGHRTLQVRKGAASALVVIVEAPGTDLQQDCGNEGPEAQATRES